MSDGKTVNLRVSKALPTDVGRGRARISGGTDLDLKPGDVVEIIGDEGKSTAAIYWRCAGVMLAACVGVRKAMF